MNKSQKLKRIYTMRENKIQCDIPEYDVTEYENRYPLDFGMRTATDDEENSSMEITDDIVYIRERGLISTYDNQSIHDSNAYYVKALIESKITEEREYRAEIVLATKKSKAWYIFDTALTIGRDYRILGDSSVIQLGPSSVEVNGIWRGDDLEEIEEIICSEVDI